MTGIQKTPRRKKQLPGSFSVDGVGIACKRTVNHQGANVSVRKNPESEKNVWAEFPGVMIAGCLPNASK